MSEAQLFAAMSFTEIYERLLVPPLFRPFAEALVARAAPVAGDSVIDVACGTGIAGRVARETLGADARIVGVDVAPAMLAVAQKTDPSIDWRAGNVVSLPVAADERFSLLLCHQGLQFFPDRAGAVREMRRVLAPGGRAAVATWRSLDDLPVGAGLNEVAERYVGPIDDVRHGLGDPGQLKRLLEEGGFSGVQVANFSHDVRLPDGALYARLNAMAVIGMSERGKALSEAERSELAGRIAADTQDLIARNTRDGEFIFPLTTNIAIARA